MTAAIFGLVGVLVGAVLGPLARAWVEHRIQRGRARNEFRVACKLVAAEISWARANCELADERDEWSYVAKRTTERPDVPEIRRSLADGLSVDDFIHLEWLYEKIQLTTLVADKAVADEMPMEQQDHETLRSLIGQITESLEGLLKVARQEERRIIGWHRFDR
ncbi:MAG: hypothetical protein R3C15_15690 [Thermoleophilia bacterium]